MPVRQIVGILLLSFGVFAALVAGLLWMDAQPASEPEPEEAEAEEEPEEAAPAPKPFSFQEGARATIPHPPGDNLPSSGAPFDQDTVREALGLVTPAVRGCVVQWNRLDPNLNGHITVELTLGMGGLLRAAVVDHLDAPKAPLVCLGHAFWSVSWPWPDQGEHMVRYPFQFFDTASVGQIDGLHQPDEAQEEEEEEEQADTQ